MEVLYKRCCGIDIHKNMMVACVFTSVRKKEIRQFSTMTEDILQLVSWLKETNCEMAAMESVNALLGCHDLALSCCHEIAKITVMEGFL